MSGIFEKTLTGSKVILFYLLLCFSLTLVAQNAPIARADTFYVCPGDTHILYPLANDNDPDADSIFLNNFIAPLPILNPPSGSFTRSGDSVIFIAVSNFSSSATGVYQVCDNSGQCSFGTYTVVLDAFCNGIKQNRPPVANPDVVAALEDVSVLIRPLENDRDPDGDPLSWEPVTQPLNGTLTRAGNNYSYRGDLNYNGFDFFLYRVCDTFQRCAFSVVTIIIAPVNDPPVARNDTFTIQEDQWLYGDVLLNDVEVDGDPLKVNIVQNPFNGTVQMDSSGKFVYQPVENYYGRDEFRYRVCDTGRFFNCAQARVLINILPVNDAPVLYDIVINTSNSGGIFVENVAAFARDAEKDTLRYRLGSTPQNNDISAVIDSVSGILQITVPSGFCGSDSFIIEACDYQWCTSATVFIKAPECVEDIELVEGFSPNGDDINDQLVFKGLELFAPAYLGVFNRNGYPVYENEDYRNDWNGTHPTSGEPLPDGTYYYVLELTKGNKRYKNFLVIHR
jgi:gliding motility-associated-like protein